MSSSVEQKLPTELLEQVLSFAPRDSLPSLCLTSRDFNRIATPFLYSGIDLKETHHLPALAYLMFTSPAHAALVESFIVPDTWARTGEKSRDWSWPGLKDTEVQSVLKAKSAAFTSSEEEANELYGKISSGESEDAIMAVLLACLPKLRRLDFRVSTGKAPADSKTVSPVSRNDHVDFRLLWPKIMNKLRSRCGFTKEANRSVTSNPSQVVQLPAVSHHIDIMVRFTGPVRRYSNYTLHLANFFHLPNVRSIYGWRLGDMGDPPDLEDAKNPFATLPPQSCPVEYIELRRSQLHKDHFQLMMDATIPGKLKTFSYEIGDRSWSWCGTDHYSIMKSLQPHYESLEGLSLSYDEAYLSHDKRIRDNAPPCSFRSFVALKRLRVAPLYIWHHRTLFRQHTWQRSSQERLCSVLPENLEELWITRTHDHITRVGARNGEFSFVSDCLLPALHHVVQNKWSALPKLRLLRIEFPLLEWKDEWFDEIASICELAAVKGIRTTIILCDMFYEGSPFTIERPWGWNEDIEWEPDMKWQPEPTKTSSNRECAKVWIDATGQEHLAAILKDMKVRFEEEDEMFRKASGVVYELWGPSVDYDYYASRDLGFPERFVDERLQKEPYWKGRGKETIPYPKSVAS
ncbi:hypothetical protein AA0113_g11755 [Alternaria arborescens]|uniref:F-box domain-containing protein n=1 Tax=Alternaria arborescens TaxID=156630 RepID=A0A4Q4Q303_9PLEO|nr:hypothetical protein AA0113_g11755 [Alternaria arborescens]